MALISSIYIFFLLCVFLIKKFKIFVCLRLMMHKIVSELIVNTHVE